MPTDDRGVAVGGKTHRNSLLCRSQGVIANKFWPLLGELCVHLPPLQCANKEKQADRQRLDGAEGDTHDHPFLAAGRCAAKGERPEQRLQCNHSARNVGARC